MPDDEAAFRTVAGRGQAAFGASGSEFPGLVAPAGTVAEADALREPRRRPTGGRAEIG